MGAQDSSDTHVLPTGTISENAWKPFVPKRQMKTVRLLLILSSPHCINISLVPPVPIFGGGDVFSSQDYWEKTEKSKVDGIMIGRGALIKPWIFTEVKERREWDISSRERLDIIRQVSSFTTDL
jgi:hypothetical protein